MARLSLLSRSYLRARAPWWNPTGTRIRLNKTRASHYGANPLNCAREERHPVRNELIGCVAKIVLSSTKCASIICGLMPLSVHCSFSLHGLSFDRKYKVGITYTYTCAIQFRGNQYRAVQVEANYNNTYRIWDFSPLTIVIAFDQFVVRVWADSYAKQCCWYLGRSKRHSKSDYLSYERELTLAAVLYKLWRSTLKISLFTLIFFMTQNRNRI